MALPLTITITFFICIVFTFDPAVECARKHIGELLAFSVADVKRILDVYFCWRDLSIDDVVNVS